LTVTFPVFDTVESELFCYAYADAVNKVLADDVTLGCIADRALITEKKYVPPKKSDCGLEWELNISMRITIEAV